jgi:hypothetical protein
MTITIRRQSTKTDAGARVIPLNADALVALMELRDRAEKLGSRYTDSSCRRASTGILTPLGL